MYFQPNGVSFFIKNLDYLKGGPAMYHVWYLNGVVEKKNLGFIETYKTF